MKKSRTTLPLSEQDRIAIATIREYYGLKTDADVLRMALYDVYRRIQKERNVEAPNK